MRRLDLNLSLKGVIVLIATGVLLPVMLTTAAGIVVLVIARDAKDMVMGVLVVCFAAAAAGSALIAVILASRKAREARQQADFLAAVSHELRTPLATIRLYTQTLQSEKLGTNSDEQQRCLDAILDANIWLDSLVERILTWRAASHDSLPLDMAIAPIVPALQNAVDRFHASLPAPHPTLEVDLESEESVAHDSEAIQTIILNLLGNALKYTPADQTIQLRCVDTEKFVQIDVIDHGVGIQPSERRHIFRAFFHGAERESARAGVGLGLSIVQYLVDRHGGTIDVTSEKGHGATFRIRLPVAEVQS